MRRKEVLEWFAAGVIVLAGLSLWVLLLRDSLERNSAWNCVHLNLSCSTVPKEKP